MKIGFDVAQTCSERAGCAWYADSLVRALVAAAPQHDFFLYHQFGSWLNADTSTGTHIVAPNVTNTFTDVTPQEAARIWKSPAELLIKTGAPDIVHATSYRAPKVPGAKLVFTVYDVSFWAVPHFTTEANRLTCQEGTLQSLRNADGFAFISQSAYQEFERLLPGWLAESRKPWVVTPLAPRTTITAATRNGTGGPYFLAVGSLEPRKNYENLLTALELYAQESAAPLPLWIAGGSGWKSAALKRRMGEMEARGLVRYLGYVNDDTLCGLLAGAHALIFPSWYEGFGLPVIESLASGCPVICSDNTSLPEAGGNVAIYVPPGQPREIANAMLRLERETGSYEDLRAKGRAWADQFTWKRTAETTLRFYETLLPRRSPEA